MCPFLLPCAPSLSVAIDLNAGVDPSMNNALTVFDEMGQAYCQESFRHSQDSMDHGVKRSSSLNLICSLIQEPNLLTYSRWAEVGC
ncbi:unnamed protein product [Urochloa humidicola]